jgi:hypothetical protein
LFYILLPSLTGEEMDDDMSRIEEHSLTQGAGVGILILALRAKVLVT